MIDIITGNLWKSYDDKEIVVKSWDHIEEWLKEKYSVHFVSVNVLNILDVISTYGNIEKKQGNKAELLIEIKHDIEKSRAEFIKKIEKFDYRHYGNNNLDTGHTNKIVYVDKLGLYYCSDNDPYRFCFEIGPKIPFSLSFPAFYHGYYSSYLKSGKSREKRYFAKATDASSIIVYADGFGDAGIDRLRTFYREIKKKVRRK